MNDLPQPLTPTDCDLRGYQWMPLDVVRVIDSDTFGISTGDEFKTAFRLWAKSWLQVPAASLPDDDRLLAHLAGLSENMAKWKRVRDVALRGWIRCADGRLYHPVIAEKAIEAMGKREEHAEREENEQSRQQRYRERRKALFETLRERGIVPSKDAKTDELERLIASLSPSPSVTESVTRDVSVNVTHDAGAMAKRGTVPDRTVNLKTIGSDHDGGIPAIRDPDAPLAAAEISKSLIGWERARGKQARGIMPSNIQVIDLAEAKVTSAELALAYERAVADRDATGDMNPINAGFVRALLNAIRNPPKPRPKPDDWSRSNDGIDRKADELGMKGRGGETYDQLKNRIWIEIRRREHATERSPA